MSTKIEVTYDEEARCLYAARRGTYESMRDAPGALPVSTRQITSDVNIDLHGVTGEAVGLELVSVPHTVAEWWTLPERAEIPTEFFDAVAEWLGARERAR